MSFNAQWNPGKCKKTVDPDSKFFEETLEKRLGWFRNCLYQMKTVTGLKSVAFPRMIGCDRAGGHWPDYEQEITSFAKQMPSLTVSIVTSTVYDSETPAKAAKIRNKRITERRWLKPRNIASAHGAGEDASGPSNEINTRSPDELSVLLLFSGKQSENHIEAMLRRGIGALAKATGKEFTVKVTCIDICRNKRHDLLDKSFRDNIKADIKARKYDVIVMCPPCNTWSRSRHSEFPGPPFVRD